jgi:hypothetical protein
MHGLLIAAPALTFPEKAPVKGVYGNFGETLPTQIQGQ